MRLFVDSSAWTALYNPRDKYRSQARDGMQALAGQDAEFVTTGHVLDETFDRHFEQMGFRLWPR